MTALAIAGLTCATGCASTTKTVSPDASATRPTVASTLSPGSSNSGPTTIAPTTATPGATSVGAVPISGAAATPTDPTTGVAPGAGSANNTGGKVQVRFLNLYATPEHPLGVPLVGFFEDNNILGAANGTGTPDFASVAYGQLSPFEAAGSSNVGTLALYAAGQTDPVSSINVIGTVQARYTFIIYSIGQPGFAAAQGFNETPSAAEVNQNFPGTLSAAPTGKGLIIAVGSPLQALASARPGFNLGQPGKGCFALQTPDPPNGGQSNIPSGGSLNYVADPGELQIAFFDSSDADCSKAPVIAPVSTSLHAGDRMLIVAYPEPSTSKLLSMPVTIQQFAGDVPLIPSPTPSTETPSSTVDPCSVITKDEAAKALGAPVDSSNGDATSGSCTFTAGAATLQLAIQTGITTTAFDALKASAAAAQPAGGIGDGAFFTSDPTSIVVLKGTTMLAVGLDRHADSGPDDPAADQPLISAVAIAALRNL